MRGLTISDCLSRSSFFSTEYMSFRCQLTLVNRSSLASCKYLLTHKLPRTGKDPNGRFQVLFCFHLYSIHISFVGECSRGQSARHARSPRDVQFVKSTGNGRTHRSAASGRSTIDLHVGFAVAAIYISVSVTGKPTYISARSCTRLRRQRQKPATTRQVVDNIGRRGRMSRA